MESLCPSSGSPLAYAKHFLAAAFSPIPVLRDGSKRPAIAWKRYQSTRADQRMLAQWFDRGEPYGIALVHGAISGNSEVTDVDLASIAPDFYAAACREIPALAGAPWIETPRPGYQLVYRNAAPVAGNLKLAEYLNPDWKEGVADVPKWKTTIETRGEGGYTVTIGSPACCHPNNKPYRLVGGSFRTIPVLTTEERVRLHAIARSCDERPAGDDRDHRNLIESARLAPSDVGDRPGDDFNRNANWPALLEPHGWQRLYTSGDIGYWRRPGKKDPGASATTNYGGYGLFYVFSSNAHPFEPERGYTPFAVFTLLEHHGDFRRAAREIGWRRAGR